MQWFGAWDQGRYQLVFGHYDASIHVLLDPLFN
jgi:hypothetical protein